MRQNPHKVSAMLHRAKKIGLDQIAQILCSELNAAKLSMMQLEQKNRALFRGSGSRALLAEPDEIDNAILPDHAGIEGSWTMVRESSSKRCRTTITRMRNQRNHEDSDNDSDGSIYEL